MLRIIIPFYSEFETCKPGLRELRAAGIPFDLILKQGALIYAARHHGINGGLTQAVRQDPPMGFSHFLFLDSDIGFRAEDVRSAMAWNLEIVAHPYLGHEGDGTYQCGELSHMQRGTIEKRYVSYELGMRRISFCGAGFLMVRRDVFRKLRYPYFRHELIESGDAAEMTGEDVGFCLNARDAGIPIHCDFDRPVYHRPRHREDFDVSY